MSFLNKHFNYLQEALEKGGWTQDGRFCLLGIRTKGTQKEALIYKEQTMVIMWQNIYEPKRGGRTFVNKQGEHVYIDDLIKYETLKKLQSMPSWNIKNNIEEY